MQYFALDTTELLDMIKKKVCRFVFDWLQDNVCDPFKNYFERKEYCQNTRNNNFEGSKMKTEFGRKSFRVTAANVYNNIRNVVLLYYSIQSTIILIYLFIYTYN